MVFQDPMTSLNPVLRIARQLQEAMVVHGRKPAEAGRRAISLLRRMGFTAPERTLRGFPHQLSGGMRQRVVLAMGMSNEPALLLADEPTTALDVTIQAQILELMRELNAEFGTAIVLISHDLGVIAGLCTRVVVMYAGEVVEEGPTEQVLADPRHPYTWALMNAVPRIDSTLGDRRLSTIEGMPPNPLAQPVGCRFSPRCPFRQPVCDTHPDLTPMGPGRASRCWVAAAGEHFTPASVPASAATPGERVRPDAPPLLVATDLVKHFPVAGVVAGSGASGSSMPSTASASPSAKARCSASSASPAAANPPSVVRFSVSTSPIPARSPSMVKRSRKPLRPPSARCAAACRWSFRTRMARSTRA